MVVLLAADVVDAAAKLTTVIGTPIHPSHVRHAINTAAITDLRMAPCLPGGLLSSVVATWLMRFALLTHRKRPIAESQAA